MRFRDLDNVEVLLEIREFGTNLRHENKFSKTLRLKNVGNIFNMIHCFLLRRALTPQQQENTSIWKTALLFLSEVSSSKLKFTPFTTS